MPLRQFTVRSMLDIDMEISCQYVIFMENEVKITIIYNGFMFAT